MIQKIKKICLLEDKNMKVQGPGASALFLFPGMPEMKKSAKHKKVLTYMMLYIIIYRTNITLYNNIVWRINDETRAQGTDWQSSGGSSL